MKNWTMLQENLVRIIIPYKDIDTTVYLLQSDNGMVMFDTASSDADIETYVFPVMEELGWRVEDLQYIFISHNHRDHARGLGLVTAAAPQAVVVSRCPQIHADYPGRVLQPEDGTVLLEVFQVVTIPGHTADSAALLDTRTGTLITGDCLQLFGIYGSGLWGANITLPVEHLQAIEKVRKLPVETIYCAHDYHPVGREGTGRELVTKMLDACVEPLMLLRTLILNHPELTDEEIAARYQEQEPLPMVAEKVVAALRHALEEGRLPV